MGRHSGGCRRLFSTAHDNEDGPDYDECHEHLAYHISRAHSRHLVRTLRPDWVTTGAAKEKCGYEDPPNTNRKESPNGACTRVRNGVHPVSETKNSNKPGNQHSEENKCGALENNTHRRVGLDHRTSPSRFEI
ncbi:MAG: hypothetical protein ABIJ00_09140 [Candidatus Eisenbacteria bacterium]